MVILIPVSFAKGSPSNARCSQYTIKTEIAPTELITAGLGKLFIEITYIKPKMVFYPFKHLYTSIYVREHLSKLRKNFV